MTPREQRGLVIAATSMIVKAPRNVGYYVPSQAGSGAKYLVNPKYPCCDCPDFMERGEPCKHVFAVQYVLQREKNTDGTVTETETLTVVKKRTYSQPSWEKYNLAQTTEKRWFLS